jgi:Transglutaminase-like superfamily
MAAWPTHKTAAAFFKLPRRDRWLVLKTMAVLFLVKLGLKVLPFRVFRQYFVASNGGSKPPNLRQPDQTRMDKLVWAVTVCSRYEPFAAACLVQALALKLLLAWHGFEAELHIGVRRGAQKEFQAHAWVERERRVLIGTAEYETYKPLWVWGG